MDKKPWFHEEPSKEYKDAVFAKAFKELEKNKELAPSKASILYSRLFIFQSLAVVIGGFFVWRFFQSPQQRVTQEEVAELNRAVELSEEILISEAGVESFEDLEMIGELDLLTDLDVIEEWES